MFQVAEIVLFNVLEAFLKLRTALLQEIQLFTRFLMQLRRQLEVRRRKETLFVDVVVFFFVAVDAAVLRCLTGVFHAGDRPVIEHQPTTGSTFTMNRAEL